MPSVKIKSDDIKPCMCGFKPTEVELWYGQTPYDIFCPTCKKQSANTKFLVTGMVDNAIDYWNNHVSNKSVLEFKEEMSSFLIEQKENTGYDGYKTCLYYWDTSRKGHLYKSSR